MNHVLQYTQLKFKFDPLTKPKILGSIPNGVANLWTLTRSTNSVTRYFKGEKESWFLSLEKFVPMRNDFVWSRHLLFIFIFKWGKFK